MAPLQLAQVLTLELDFILNNQRLALVVDDLGEFGRDGVMGGGVLDHQALITLNTLEDGRFLNSPFADVSPLLFGRLVVLFGVRFLPPLIPVVGELLEERRLELGSLEGYMLVESRARL